MALFFEEYSTAFYLCLDFLWKQCCGLVIKVVACEAYFYGANVQKLSLNVEMLILPSLSWHLSGRRRRKNLIF